MRQFLFITLFFTVIFGTSYWYTSSAYICPAPIKYKVGEIDPRFNFTAEEAKKVLLDAEAVWETTANRELFVYDENSPFAVNFIYDERQQLARTEEEWRAVLDEQEKASKDISDKVASMNQDYKALEVKYQEQRNSYETKLSTYNAKVESYNKEGGAPDEVYSSLRDEQRYLAGLMKKLIEAENNLNVVISQINTLGDNSNKAIEEYNANVQKYNEIFGKKDTFTQGDFKRDRINIYKFSDTAELTRVLTHEFGHSLGIKHVENEDSVMYYLTKEQLGALILSDQDKEALVTSCGNGTELSHKTRQIIRTLLAQFNI